MTEQGKIRVFSIPQEEIAKPRTKPKKKNSTKKTAADISAAMAALVEKFAALNKEDYRDLAESPRRRSREAALLLFFQMEMGGEDWDLASAVFKDIELNETGSQFAWQLAQNAVADQENSDRLMGIYARQWTLDRFPAIDRCVLRLAISELLRDENDTANIIINEAIELSKKFGDENSGAFVNGILDTIRTNELNKVTPEDLPK